MTNKPLITLDTTFPMPGEVNGHDAADAISAQELKRGDSAVHGAEVIVIPIEGDDTSIQNVDVHVA